MPAWSQDSAGGIAAGAFTIHPTIGLTYGHDDNVTLANRPRVSSDFTILAPAIQLVASGATSQFVLRYEFEKGEYKDSPIDDYTDHNFGFDLNLSPSVRNDFRFYGRYTKSHDRRGTALREGDIGLLEIEPDRWDEYGIGGTWRYGALGAKGALEIEAGHRKRDYTNHHSVTQFLDYSTTHAAARFFYRVRPKTELLAEARWEDIDYVVSPYDAIDTRFLVGVRWDATARTSGRVLLGQQHRDFDDPGLQDYSGVSWEVGLTWTPRTYSIIDLSTIRHATETTGLAAYRVTQDTVLRWDHYWKPRFNTTVEYGFSDHELRPNVRDDDVYFWGVSAQYAMRPWVRFGLGHRYIDRQSTDDEFNYDRNVTQFTVELTVP